MARAVGLTDAMIKGLKASDTGRALFDNYKQAKAVGIAASSVVKLHDGVGLYVSPPAHSIVLSVDEKRQIQAQGRPQPGFR